MTVDLSVVQTVEQGNRLILAEAMENPKLVTQFSSHLK